LGDAGFYSPGGSWLHRTHGAAKIFVFAVAVPVLPLLLTAWWSLLALAIFLAALVASARVRRRQLLYFSPALAIIAVAGLSWLFVDLGGPVVFRLDLGGPVRYALRAEALERSASASLRALVWALSYVALLATTPSRDLVAGLDRLGVPDRVSRAVAMTLRFWGTVISDTRNVVEAQRARGLDFEGGSRFGRLWRRFVSAAVPTVFVVLKRFQTLSFALALRGVGSSGPKSRLYAPPLAPRDVALSVAAVCLLSLLWLADGGVLVP